MSEESRRWPPCQHVKKPIKTWSSPFSCSPITPDSRRPHLPGPQRRRFSIPLFVTKKTWSGTSSASFPLTRTLQEVGTARMAEKASPPNNNGDANGTSILSDFIESGPAQAALVRHRLEAGSLPTPRCRLGTVNAPGTASAQPDTDRSLNAVDKTRTSGKGSACTKCVAPEAPAVTSSRCRQRRLTRRRSLWSIPTRRLRAAATLDNQVPCWILSYR